MTRMPRGLCLDPTIQKEVATAERDSGTTRAMYLEIKLENARAQGGRGGVPSHFCAQQQNTLTKHPKRPIPACGWRPGHARIWTPQEPSSTCTGESVLSTGVSSSSLRSDIPTTSSRGFVCRTAGFRAACRVSRHW